MRNPVIGVIIACFLLFPAASAQNVSSSVTGLLLDSTGAALVGAECILTNQATGATTSARSTTDGGFTFPNLLAGKYNLSVKLAGFKSLETKDIVISSGEIRGLGRLQMQVGEVRESISVEAIATAVQTASAEKSGVITGSQLNDIAVRGRDFFTYLSTIPGVVDNFSQRRETSSPDSIRGTFINGGRENQKNLTVDGVTDMDTGSNSTIHFQPNMDAISEVKVMTSNYQAEFGRNGAGVITIITKGGAKDFHGSAYYFYRHESLNANSFFNNRTGTAKAPYRYRINGYSIGGPAYIPKVFNKDRDKLFFFWSQEYVGMRKDYGARFANMPTDLERRGDYSRSFDVNAALIAVKDPLTGQNFPGNVIPASRISSLGQKMLSYFPLPNYTDPDPRQLYQRNFRSQYSGAYPKRQDMIRIDGNFWQSFQFYYRFIKDKDEQDTPYGMWVNGGINYFLTPVRFGQPGKGHVVRMNKMFTSTLINEFTFGKSRNNLYFTPVDPSVMGRDKVGNPAEWYKDDYLKVAYAPNITFGGQPANPVNFSWGNIPYQNYNDIYSYVDNVSKIWKTHTLKAGVYIERTGKFQVGGGNYRGAFNFSRDTNNPYDTNHSFANALIGNFQSYSEATKRVDGDWWFWNVEWYLQDNWRVNKRLTLDYGIRIYHLPPMEDLNRTLSAFDPTLYSRAKAPLLYVPCRDTANRRVACNPQTGAFAPAPMIGLFVPNSGNYSIGMRVGGVDAGAPPGLYEAPKIAFGPRLGFAWDVFGTGKTALRGGFGMFKDRMQGNPTFNLNGQPPVAYSPTLYYGDLSTYATAPGAIGPSGSNMLYGPNDQSTTMNFSLGVQHQIWRTVVDASYVGGQSRHLMASLNINPIAMYARFDKANEDPTNPGRPLPDVFLRPYFGHQDINYRFNGVWSNYNSFQLSANRRFTRGLQFGIAYTWSRTMGVADSDTSGLSPYFAWSARNYGPAGFDRRHIFVANYIWDVPGLGKRFNSKPLGWITDNWQISGITSFISGAPFTPGFSTTDGADITGSTEGARVNISGDTYLPKDQRTFYRNFNTNAFARPASRSFGNAGVNSMYGPGVNNWDISVSKRFPVFSEARYLQLRGEFFNTWNHTQFSGMDTSARFDTAGAQVNPTFGQFTSARDPRLIQLSLRFNF
ncbi:MAG: TonB-dependent receptor [Candidatus Solibacter usitatus]|nr:TonB-dependent receptor [Candidatus Solibacter usitatus]